MMTGALRPHRLDRLVEERQHARVEAGEAAHDADAGALEPGRIEELRVIGVSAALAPGGGGIPGIDTDAGTEQDGGVPHRSAHGSRRVL